jgi:hypothetical protein
MLAEVEVLDEVLVGVHDDLEILLRATYLEQ